MKLKSIFFLVFLLLLGTAGIVSAQMESLVTKGEGTPALTPPTGKEKPIVSLGSFTSFNIDVGRKFTSGSAITPDGTTVYVMNYDPTISVIDATQDIFVKTIDLSAGSPGNLSGGVVVNDKLYAVGMNNVVIMDTTTEAIVNTIPQSFAGGIVWGRAVTSPTKDRVYTVFGCVDTMLAIDTSTYTLIGSANIGNENTGIGISPSGDKIYISDRINGELTIVDTSNFSVIDVKLFITGTGIIAYSTAVAVGLDGIVYVGYVDNDVKFNVAILDVNGNLLDTIATSGWSTGLEISTDGKYLITGNGNIIDVSTRLVIDDVAAGGGEYQVNVSPDGSRAYVTNYNSTFITVIEGFTPLSSLTISPPSGDYVTTQGFDLTLIVEAPVLSVVGGSATLDGSDVTDALAASIIPGTLVSGGGQTFRCPGITGSFLGTGTHTLNVTLDLSDSSSVSDTVNWEVKENTEP